MATMGLRQLPDDIVAAIVLRAFRSGGATLLAHLNMSLVCRAWKAALAACAVSLDFWEPVTAAQRQWLATTGYRVASLSFAPVRSDGTGADPAFTWLLLGRPRGENLLAGAAGTLAAVRNLAVPLDADGVATLQRLGGRFPALRSLGIALRMQSVAGTAANAQLARVLQAVPAAVEHLHITFLDDILLIFEGARLSHLRALRRLTLHAPRVEALFCVMEGLPPGLAVVTFSAPAGEVVVMLDRDANRLAEPLDVFTGPVRKEAVPDGGSTSVLGRGLRYDSWRAAVQLTIVDATHCCGVNTGTGDDAVSLRAGRGWIKKS